MQTALGEAAWGCSSICSIINARWLLYPELMHWQAEMDLQAVTENLDSLPGSNILFTISRCVISKWKCMWEFSVGRELLVTLEQRVFLVDFKVWYCKVVGKVLAHLLVSKCAWNNSVHGFSLGNCLLQRAAGAGNEAASLFLATHGAKVNHQNKWVKEET